jgi:outer membrane protein assembly factor BamD (BamD/ComL family)
MVLAILVGCGNSASESKPAAENAPQTEEGLYAEAQKAENENRPGDAITIYRKILADYPDSPQSYKAQFLVGFVFSEEMNLPDSGRIAFQAVIDKYPNSEFVDDAQAMLKFLEGEMPQFEEQGKPVSGQTDTGH